MSEDVCLCPPSPLFFSQWNEVRGWKMMNVNVKGQPVRASASIHAQGLLPAAVTFIYRSMSTSVMTHGIVGGRSCVLMNVFSQPPQQHTRFYVITGRWPRNAPYKHSAPDDSTAALRQIKKKPEEQQSPQTGGGVGEPGPSSFLTALKSPITTLD